MGQSLSRLLVHLRTPLYANAYALVANQIVSAGLGVLYWLLAARLYTTEVVGQSSATISTLLFLAALAELSLKSAMTRFVPRAGVRSARLILYGYGVNLAIAVLVGGLFFLVGSRLQFAGSLLTGASFGAGWLILMMMAWVIFYVQDGVLTGLGQAVWVLIENTLYNVFKICLLVVGLRLFQDNGIVTSWFLPAPFLVLLVTLLIFGQFVPRHIAAAQARVIRITPRQVIRSVTGDHIGTLLAETSARLLPLMVLLLLGKSANAYFYQAWLVANTLYYIAGNIANSFTVEAAANLSRLAVYSRRILWHMARLIVPAAIAIFIAAPLGLGFFGAAYAQQGTALLRWLAVAGLPIILNTWYLSYARVVGDSRAIILNQGLVCVATLGLSYWWLPSHGIASIGIAWLIGQTLAAVLAAIKTAPMLLDQLTHAAPYDGAAHHGSHVQAPSVNLLLRRADWRFLLPSAQPRTSVVFTDGLLAQSVAEISGRLTLGLAATARDCDLAVAVDPSPSTLRAAHESLREDGVCYTEWTAWRAGGAAGIRRRLQAAGFRFVSLYWPGPDPEAPRFWLTLQPHRAPYYYLVGQLFSRDNLPHRLMRGMLSVILQAVVRVGLVPHLSAIAYKSAREVAYPVCGDVAECIRAEWSRAHADMSPESLSFLVRTGGQRVDNKINYLVFAGSDVHPRWVVKLPRVGMAAQALRREHDILQSLRSAERALRDALVVPRVELWRSVNGTWMLGQTALAGTPLSVMVRRDNFQELAGQMVESLARWAGRPQVSPRELWWDRLVEPLLERAENGFGAVLKPNLLQQTRIILSELGNLPLVYTHNDCAPWNVVKLEKGLGVFDWDGADPQGLPLTDLIYFMTNMAFRLDEAVNAQGMVESYRMLLNPESDLGRIFHASLLHYAERVGLDSASIRPLRLLTWLFHLRCEHKRFVIESGGRPPIEALQASVCLPLWETELGF